MELREQLDQAIGDGPPLPPPEERLAAGRAAARRRRTRVAAGAVAAVVAVVLPLAGLGWSRDSGPGHVGPATSPSGTTESSPPTTDPTTGDAGARAIRVKVVDGVPELVGHPAGVAIGPVVRGAGRAFGLEVRLRGERSFVLLVRDDPGWQLRRLVTAEPGDDLATWLRAHGWLPTGESS